MATAHWLIYSGWENPHVTLSEEDKKHILSQVLLQTEVVLEKDAPPSRLGDSGVMVQCDEGDPIVAFVAYKGVLRIYAASGELPYYMRDPDGAIEAFLRKLSFSIV